MFQQLFAEAHGVESQRSRAHGAHAQRAQAIHHPANAQEVGEVFLEAFRLGMRSMFAGQGVFETVLTQVIADGNLAAEAIAAALNRQIHRIIRIGLHQDRHIQLGQFQGINHAFFIAEVGHAD